MTYSMFSDLSGNNSTHLQIYLLKSTASEVSLVIQWLRTCLLMQKTWV